MVIGDGDERVVLAIVTAVAETKDVSVESIEKPLETAIDVDSLEAIVESPGFNSVTFRYNGCEVTVISEETVHVENIDTSREIKSKKRSD